MIFVWEYIGPVSSNWHSSGGVLVVAENVDRAKTMVDELRRGFCTEFEKPEDFDPLGESGFTAELVGDQPERIMVFEDAGCC